MLQLVEFVEYMYTMVLRSFEIRFEYELDDSDWIRKWWADSAVVPQTTLNIQQKNFNHWDLFYVYDFMFV